MAERYAFEFPGTMAEFLKKLEPWPTYTNLDEDKYYYIQDYIVKITDNAMQFGVERAGHSGGLWFIPLITEYDDRIVLTGTLEYIGPNDNGPRSKWKKFKDGFAEGLMYILLVPIVLGILLYRFGKKMICKLFGKPIPQEKTTEEKLFDLMENHLACVRK